VDPGRFEEITPEWFDHFWSGNALTMCGEKKLDNLRWCIEQCLERQVPGDLIECGVWRGGASIFMRGVLAAHGVGDRTVWLADSFQGLPPPPPGSLDEKMYNWDKVVEIARLAVGLDAVKSNFRRYGLLDGQVQFLAGWFQDTLPRAPVKQVAVLRVDADSYEATTDILTHLYPKLSPGGYVILDDWGLDNVCGEKQAALAYRRVQNIREEIVEADWQCAYWRKGAPSAV
ncbi:MAG: TylF/MycF/NovP-related O-methyltransferase, partial [Candidatus Binatia bacterium]